MTRRASGQLLSALILAMVLASCAARERGPFENAGHEIDKGIDKTGRTVEKGAKDTGSALERFGHDVSDFFDGLFD